MSDACQVGCGRVFRGAESMEKCERHEKTCDGTPKALRKALAKPKCSGVGTLADECPVHAPPGSPAVTKAKADSVATAVLCLARWRDSLPKTMHGGYLLGVCKALEVADALDTGHLADLRARVERDGLA